MKWGNWNYGRTSPIVIISLLPSKALKPSFYMLPVVNSLTIIRMIFRVGDDLGSLMDTTRPYWIALIVVLSQELPRWSIANPVLVNPRQVQMSCIHVRRIEINETILCCLIVLATLDWKNVGKGITACSVYRVFKTFLTMAVRSCNANGFWIKWIPSSSMSPWDIALDV